MKFIKIDSNVNTGILSISNDIIIKSHFKRGTDECYLEAVNNIDEQLWVVNITNNEIGTYLYCQSKFTYFQNYETTIYDTNTGGILQKEFKYYFFISDYFSLYIDLNNENELVYHSKEKVIKFEYVFSHTYISEKYLIYTYSDQIMILNFKAENQIKIKLFDLTGLNTTKIYGPIIPCEDKFFVYINGTSYEDNFHKTFCIDINSGEVVKAIEKFNGYMQSYGNIIYTINGHSLQILNATTLVYSDWNFQEIATENGFYTSDSSLWLISNEYLYFVQNIGDTKAKVGVLDFINRTFIDKIELNETDGSIIDIKVQNDKLFIHTVHGTLHIFEKTQSNKTKQNQNP